MGIDSVAVVPVSQFQYLSNFVNLSAHLKILWDPL